MKREHEDRIGCTIVLIFLIIVLALFLSGCKSKIQYVPIETIKTEKKIETVHDTIVQVKLVPYYAQSVVPSDSSFIENKYAFSNAFWDGSLLHHDLGIKDINIPVNIKYVDRWHFSTDSIPYIKEVPVKGDTIYKMYWHEQIFYYIGLLVTIAAAFFGIYKLVRWKFFSA